MFKIRFFVLLTLVVLLIFPVVAQNDEAPVLRVGGFGTQLREGSSPDDLSIASLPTGTEVLIVGFNQEADSYLVVSDEGIGWISASLTSVSGNLELVPLLTYESLAEIPQLELEESVVLYQLPDAESDVIAEIENTSLYILAIDETESYLLVVHEGLSGWLSIETVADSDLDFSELAIIGGEASIEACMISTGQASTVRVRVGYGENRTSVTFLEADTVFEAVGYNTDDNGTTWYALDKEDSAPGKSIVGDVAWVLATEVDTTGDCDALSIVEAEHIRFIVPTPSSSDIVSDGSNLGSSTTISVPASAGWLDSGVYLTQGQSYSISASGIANVWEQCWAECPNYPDNDCDSLCPVAMNHGPGGSSGPMSIVASGSPDYHSIPLTSAYFGALVGRVGNGTPFEIGAGGTFIAPSDGNLHFVHNDFLVWLNDNSGAFIVTITVR